MGNGRRSLPCFVGEQRPSHAEQQRGSHGSADEGAGGFLGRERGADDQEQHLGDPPRIDDENVGPGEQIEGDHDGDEPAGHGADALHTADDHHAYQDGQHDATDNARDAKVLLGDVADVPGLEHVAAGGGGNQERQAEHASEQLAGPDEARIHALEPLACNPHGAAVRVIRIVGVAIQHGQRHFGELDGHAEEPHDPHPEHGSGTAERDRQGHAADVAQPHRG